MHHEWEHLNEWKAMLIKKELKRLNNKTNFDYVRHIAEQYDEKNQKFDEIDLFSMMDTTGQEQQLLNEQILQNKNILYSIVTREPEIVTKYLHLDYVDEMEVEPIYKTNFQLINTDLFQRRESVDIENGFRIIDMQHPHPYHKIPTFIRHPKE